MLRNAGIVLNILKYNLAFHLHAMNIYLQQAMKPGILKMKKAYALILLFLAIKFVYYIQSYASLYPNYNRLEINYFGDRFLQTYSNNDAGWYEKIAEHGYPEVENMQSENAELYAFFPAFPMAGRWIALLFHIPVRLALFLLVTLLSLAMLMAFFAFVKEYTKDETVAFFSALALIVFPHHYYFSMLYTESLFLLLVVLSFYAVLKNKFWLLALSGSLLVITRVNGILILLPLLVFMNRNAARGGFKIYNYYAFVPIILTYLMYLLYLKTRTGDYFAFSTAADNGWGRHLHSPFTMLYDTLIGPAKNSFLKYNAIYGVLFLALSVLFLFKKQYSFFLLSALVILLPLCSANTVAMPRYISVAFPFSILFGTWIAKSKAPYLFITLLFIAQLVTFGFWNITHPLSF